MADTHIGVALMLKNEQDSILVSLDTVKTIMDTLYILDTGSTDNTKGVITDYAKVNKIRLVMSDAVFVNFSVTRNVLLEMIEKDYHDPNTTPKMDYILLLDAADELRKAKDFKKFVSSHNRGRHRPSAFYMKQKWGDNLTYRNIRCIKPELGWRYAGAVHEYLHIPTPTPVPPPVEVPESSCLFQDRTKYGGSSIARYERDKALLEGDITDGLRDKKDTSRSFFYLAQTLACMGRPDKALVKYATRSTMPGFTEEQFEAYLRAAKSALTIGLPIDHAEAYVRKSICIYPKRAEGPVLIARYYVEAGDHDKAFCWLLPIMDVDYPKEAKLFVDAVAYSYDRYHLMSRCAYYVGQKEIGKGACQRAIEAQGLDIDKGNMRFYV